MTTEEYKEAATYCTSKERKEMPLEQLKPIVEEYLSAGSCLCSCDRHRRLCALHSAEIQLP